MGLGSSANIRRRIRAASGYRAGAGTRYCKPGFVEREGIIMFAGVGGARLHYQQTGTGPDLLLVPGLGASTHFWYAQSRDLSPHYRVTAVDPRGHGLSSTPPGPFSIESLAQDLRGLIETAGLRRPVVVASSMSCMTALTLAAEAPDAVSALALVGGFPRLEGVGRERMAARAETADREGMEPLVEPVAAAALGATTHREQPGLVGLFRQALGANDPAGYAASARAIVAADLTPRLGAVHCPVLLVVGAEEQVAPLPAAQALQAGLRDARIRVLPAAGHLPFLEQPHAFNAVLLEFLGGLVGAGWENQDANRPRQ
jgi:pimeloyl-ACP methyl ester carboxylesterase